MRQRKKFRLSLRFLLVATVLFGSAIGFIVDRARRQHDVTQWIMSNQGSIAYDYETISSKLNEKEWEGNGWAPSPWQKMDGRPFGPKFLQDFLGIDYVSTVVGVEVCDFDFPINSLSRLKSLPNLQHLTVLVDDSVRCDFSAISNLTELRRLEFYGCTLEHLPQLDQLENLQVIILLDTGISNISTISTLLELERIDINSRVENTSALGKLTALKWVSIQTVDFEIGDFANLQALEYLELDVQNCPLSNAEFKKLESMLPTTEISIWSNGTHQFESKYHDESKYETIK